MANLPSTDVIQRDVQGMIDSICIMEPEMKDRLTTAAVVNYMKLPDSSFGWSSGQMQWESKMLAVTTHLKLGLLPGTGAIFWLGNSIYISAAAARMKANSDPNWVVLEEKWEALPKDVFDAFGLEAGDMAIILRRYVKKGNNDPVWLEGIGIADKGEIEKNKVWGKAAHNGYSKKNVIQNLRTRAERDLLKRHYPLGGVPIYDKTDPEAFDVTPSEPEPTPEERKAKFVEAVRNPEPEVDPLLGDALDQWEQTYRTALGMGMTEDEIKNLIGATIDEINDLKDSDSVIAANAALCEFADNRPANPPNGSAPPKDNSASVDEPSKAAPKKRGRGRPRKTETPANETKANDRELSEERLQEIDSKLGNADAHDMINTILDHPAYDNDELRQKLEDMKGLFLEEGDKMLIAEAARFAQAGKFAKLDDLIANRSRA